MISNDNFSRLVRVQILMAAACCVSASVAFAADDPRDVGRGYTTMFYERKLGDLWGKMGEGMKGALKTLDNLQAFRTQIDDQLGEEIAVVSEDVTKEAVGHTYSRHAKFKKSDRIIDVVFSFDDKGVIQGFFVRPAQKEADSPNLDYKTKAALRLPFDGAWYVFWGGRKLAENYHAVSPQQRFALDLLIMKDGKSHTGDGKSNEQYHCFGQPILAPGDGVVSHVEDGVEDNVPGVLNPKQPVGNHVVIDHGQGEFSFLAHFKKGSVKVVKGQKLKAGDLLGLCGNSGNSSEAHLHYHLQDVATFNQGLGLPAQFQQYIADEKPVDRGEPIKGQTIRHGAKKP